MTTIEKLRIKKTKNGNEYLLTKNNIWVRNPNKDTVPYIDINSSYRDSNYGEFYKNEKENQSNFYLKVDKQLKSNRKILKAYNKAIEVRNKAIAGEDV